MYIKSNGRTVFTGVHPEDFAPFVIMIVRDPINFTRDPAEVIGEEMLKDPKMVSESPMMGVCNGNYKGIPISIISTGTGGPARELAMGDLIHSETKVHTVIDIGSSGTYQESVKIGDIVISLGDVRTEGTTKEYVDAGYPALAHYEVVMALVEASEDLGYPYHVGLTRSDDSIYVGSGVPVRGYLPPHRKGEAEKWQMAGVLNVQREIAQNFIMCNLFGFRGGSVRRTGRNFVTGDRMPDYPYSLEMTYHAALEGIVLLSKWDAAKEKAGRKWLTPSVFGERK
jgi:uridine phosphorylase